MVKKNRKLTRSNKKLLTISVSVATFLILAAIWATAAIVTKTDSDVEESNATTQKVEKTLTGKNDDQNRKDALSVATEILNASLISPSKDKFEGRLEKLDKGDFSVVDKSLSDKMRFKDTFEDDDTLKSNSYQSLITLSSLMRMAADTEVIAVKDKDSWTSVYVDSEAGIAFVPLSVYPAGNTGFSLELVYSEEGWKLSPYSLIDSVRLSASIQESFMEENPNTEK